MAGVRHRYDYFVFGGRLRSQLEFPDLSPAPNGEAPDRELSIVQSDPPSPIDLIGTREIEPGWSYQLNSVEGGQCLEYGSTGSFGIYEGGRKLVWYPDPDSPLDPEIRLEMVRAILLGPVMALALHQSGILCLHGSAVTIGGRAVAFLAPKHYGKSTLALALTAEGARLLTDDLVAIDTASPPEALPGVHSVRLLADVAEHVREAFGGTVREGFKKTLTNFPINSLAWTPAPLDAIYLIRPARSTQVDGAVSRQVVSRIPAASSLAQEKKLTDGLMGLQEAGVQLGRIASVVRSVPVYELRIVRDLARLREAVAVLMAWHGATSDQSTPARES